MSNLTKISLFDEDKLTVKGKPAVRCVVESPRGSPIKFKYDPRLKAFVMGQSLIKGLTYPFDWGFFPSTMAADGDPADVMILYDCHSFSGLVVPAQLVGVLEVVQREDGKKERNDRFFCVPAKAHREDELNDVLDLPKRLRQELEQFFLTTAKLEDKKLDILGWQGPKRAKKLLNEAAARFAGTI